MFEMLEELIRGIQLLKKNPKLLLGFFLLLILAILVTL